MEREVHETQATKAYQQDARKRATPATKRSVVQPLISVSLGDQMVGRTEQRSIT